MQIKIKINNFLVNTYKKLFKGLPINNENIYFTSFYGQYNDNPKYISEYIHGKNKKLKIIWEISDKSSDVNIPEYVIKVKRLTVKGLYYRYTAKVLVGNQIGENSKYIYAQDNATKVEKEVYSLKKKGQLILSTWHGTPLKKMSLDTDSGKEITDLATDLDKLVLGDVYTSDILKRLFFDKVNIELLGSPRNDILINGNNELELATKQKLRLPCEKKILLFAPTFRSNENNDDDIFRSGILQLEQIDFDRLLMELSTKFGGEWIFVCRFHNHVSSKINWDDISKQTNGRVINGNMNDDMAEYLLVSDALLTDATSSIFDFALTKKPCFLFFPDFSFYKNKERGLYLDLETLPFPLSENFESLLENIQSFDIIKYSVGVTDLLTQIGNIDDGKASERIGNLVIEYMSEQYV